MQDDKIHALAPLTSLNTITVVVTDRQYADLLCSALEGGSNYWIEQIYPHPGKSKAAGPWGHEYTPSYIRAPFTGNLGIRVSDEGGGDSTPDGKLYKLDRETLRAGMHTFARECPGAFGDFLAENGDAGTGDQFLQCCLFGKVVYG